MGSPLYYTSKFLTNIPAPIQNHNGYSVSTSFQFSKETTNTEHWYPLMLFLYSLPSLLTKPVVTSERSLKMTLFLHSRTKLVIDDIVSLLNFVLSHNYFVYKDKINKQIHVCAMGNPASLVVANLCMEEIEPRIRLSTQPPSPRDFFNALFP